MKKKRLLLIASNYFNDKNYKKALTIFNQFIKYNPNSVHGYINKAACYNKLNQTYKAFEIYQILIEKQIGDTKEIKNLFILSIFSLLTHPTYQKRFQTYKHLFHHLDIPQKIQVAIHLYEKKHYSNTIPLFEILVLISDDKIIFDCLLKCYTHLKLLDHANTLRLQLLNNNKFYKAGRLVYEFGSFSEAHTYCQIHHNLYPLDHVNNFYLCISALRCQSLKIRNNLEKKINDCKQLLKNNPSKYDTMTELKFDYLVFSYYTTNNYKYPSDFVKKLNHKEANNLKKKIIIHYDTDTYNQEMINKNNKIVFLTNVFCLLGHNDSDIIYDNQHIYVGRKQFFSYGITPYMNKTNTIHLKNKTFLISYKPSNYYHFLLENIGKLTVLEKHNHLQDMDILFSNNMPSFVGEALNSFNYNNLLIIKENTNYKCDQLVVVDYQLSKDFYNDSWSCYLPSNYLIHSIYDKFLSTKHYENIHVIYVSRSNGNIRCIHNNDLLIENVLKKIYGKDLIIFDHHYLEKHTNRFQAQINLFKNAKIVIGPHGAGLSNIIFSNKNTKLIEFIMNPNCNLCFQYLADMKNIKYYPIDLFTSYYHTNYTFEKKHVQPLIHILQNINNNTYSPLDFTKIN